MTSTGEFKDVRAMLWPVFALSVALLLIERPEPGNGLRTIGRARRVADGR